MEFECGRAAATTIQATIASISKVIKGMEPLSAKTQEEANSIIRQEVPASWEKVWEGPEDPLEYCKAIVNRCCAVDKWLSKARAASTPGGWLKSGEAARLNLSNWFHPCTFLSALRQCTAQLSGMSIDKLRLVTCWGHSGQMLEAAASFSLEIEGLRMQGGTFDGSKLGIPSQVAQNTQPTDYFMSL